jgi:putative phosphoribosyl transferase
MAPFRDRRDAGRELAAVLVDRDLRDPVVLALPRGGVPVAFEVADALGAPLDIVIVRKVGAPFHQEFGIGAVAEGGARVADEEALRLLDIDQVRFDELAARELSELDRRVARYRKDRPRPTVEDRDAVVVDDGLATGVTAEAAMAAVRAMCPRRVILAVPTCALRTAQRLRAVADEVICVMQPAEFTSVGQWYVDFTQVSDETVVDLLDRAAVHSQERG